MSSLIWDGMEVAMIIADWRTIPHPSDRPVKKTVKKTPPWLKKLRLLSRMFFFASLYVFWPLFRQWVKPAVVFLVYPGTIKDSRAYFPKWASRFLRAVFPLGLLRFGSRWGLYGATQTSAEDLDNNPEKIRDILEATLKEFPKARVIALAGRLPGFVRKAGIELQAPFVDGSLGTRYAMREAALEVAKLTGKCPEDVNIALLGGAGYTGSQLIQDCKDLFRTIIALDPRYGKGLEQEGSVVCTSDPTNLLYADAAVVLTARGDDIVNTVPYFRAGAVVADDTHPCIHQPIRERLMERGVTLKKAIARDGRLAMYPRLPNFRSDNIPGCLLEALVVLQRGREVLASPGTFFKAAHELHFKAELMDHPDD